MKGIVAYARPRGIYGRYVFTVFIKRDAGLAETVEIKVTRPSLVNVKETITYSCNHCGKWTSIEEVTITRTVPGNVEVTPDKYTVIGMLDFYRYDNVEPGDKIEITIRDPGLLFYQITGFTIQQETVYFNHACYSTRDNPHLHPYSYTGAPKKLYEVSLYNWDLHCQQREQEGRPMHVEEEIIQQTMNAEPIRIKQLLLEEGKPPRPMERQIEQGGQVIEGELRYL